MRLPESTSGSSRSRDVLEDAHILIIDDCALYSESLAAVFVANDLVRPSIAWDAESLVAALTERTPDIILLNVGTRESAMLLQTASTISAITRMIAMAVSEDDESEIVACAEAGVCSYHLRTDSLDELLDLMRRVLAGESVCPPGVSAILLRRLTTLAAEQRQPPVRELVLTAREAQILRMLELGLSNREIAAQLCIAVHTVKNHVHSLLNKLGVGTRTEAAALSRTIRFPAVPGPN